MTDILQMLSGWFAYVVSSFTTSELIIGAFFLVSIFLLVRVMNDSTNDLEWADLISSRGIADGKQHADIDKVGKVCGVVLAVWLPFFYAHSDKMDSTGLSLVMITSFAYLAGVSGYSAWLRSKQSGDQNVNHT